MGARKEFVEAVRRAVLDWNNGLISSSCMSQVAAALYEYDSRLPQNQCKRTK